QLRSRQLREHVAGEIVESRPEPARNEHNVRARNRAANDVQIGLEVVGDGHMICHRDPDGLQFEREPLAVRVELGTGGQFGADGNDFCVHQSIRRSAGSGRGTAAATARYTWAVFCTMVSTLYRSTTSSRARVPSARARAGWSSSSKMRR